LGKNRLEKVRKHVFYKHTNIVTKKWGEKTREKTFPETHVYRELQTMEKSSGKSAKTRFFIKNKYCDQKMGEKKREKFFS